MTDPHAARNLEIANRWCEQRGAGWQILDTAGRGGTAPVFSVQTPMGERALKLLDEAYSTGDHEAETEKRVALQVNELGDHDCPYLVKTDDGGRFEDRFYLLMSKAPGKELAKCLEYVPREKITTILDQVTTACIFLRNRRICHRDIKSANIFVTDDFNHSTLLDLSVIRKIDDAVGIGTDHGGQLPVVATSRYSPPEYLFRLVDPSSASWHALDVYQLGGVLHDLIMRYEMYEEDYRLSRDNRYRFAWIVATQYAPIVGNDIDPALLLLARRALDKDWQRRSQLRLDDFVSSQDSRRRVGLDYLGFSTPSPDTLKSTQPDSAVGVVKSLANSLREQIVSLQRTRGVTPVHKVVPGRTEREAHVVFEWTAVELGPQADQHEFLLRYDLLLVGDDKPSRLSVRATLKHEKDGEAAEIQMPDISVDNDTANVLFTSCAGVIGDLASLLLSQREIK